MLGKKEKKIPDFWFPKAIIGWKYHNTSFLNIKGLNLKKRSRTCKENQLGYEDVKKLKERKKRMFMVPDSLSQ